MNSAAQNVSELRVSELREAKTESTSLRARLENLEQRLKDTEEALVCFRNKQSIFALI